MLQEDNVLETLKQSPKYKQLQKAKKIFLINKFKKIIKYTLIISISVAILFFPIETGSVIGDWINNFFGTIYKNSIK